MDALIFGSGPSGLAIAQVLAEAGLKVEVIAPEPFAPWRPGYGAWVDELEGFETAIAHTWPAAWAGFGATRQRLERPYARLNNPRLAARLAGDYPRRVGRVAQVDPQEGTATLADGTQLRASLLIDATGLGLSVWPAQPGPGPGVQVAFGRLLQVAAHPFGDEVCLMDFDDTAFGGELQADRISSFLYALPFGPQQVFVEETSLVARPPVPMALLEARLERRLQVLGVSGQTLELERCAIPMGAPRPEPIGRLVAFGAAASMVHPATGYLLGQVFAALPRIRDGIPGPKDTLPERIAAAIWPKERAKAHDLYRFGMEVLLELDPPGLRRFFQGFFALPEAEWAGYLSGRLSIPGMASAMARVFGAVPFAVRARIAQKAVGPARRLLWTALLSG
ncbi:MAG: lycopene cyclase family protein [Deltaproteobacteria bacterium]|jgi:lycopene beta-cyclase|nr:lycopene cyclase family protein [Deltaproteobacteria bacterium]